MAQSIGKLSNIGIGKESTAGTAVAPDFVVPVLNKNPGYQAEYVNDDSDYGVQFDTVDSEVVYKKSEPSFDGYVYDQSIGLLLLAAVGSVSSTSHSGAYKHTYDLLNTNAHPSLTVAYKDSNQNEALPYCMLRELSFTFERRQLARYSAQFVGQPFESASNTFSYPTDENKFSAAHLSFKTASSVAGLSGASNVNVVDLSITITKEIIEHDALGSAEPVDIFNGPLQVSMEYEIIADNETYRDYMNAGTKRAVKVSAINTGVTIGTTNPELSFIFDSVAHQAIGQPVQNNDMIKQRFTCKAHYDTSAASAISVELVNEHSSY